MLTAEELEMLSSAIELFEETRFDEAKTAFENIIFKYPDNAQAYWGRLLSRYHISYITNGFDKPIPRCPTRSGANILDDFDYLQAMTHANDKEKSYMQEQAEYIKASCIPKGLTKNRVDRFSLGEVDPNDAFARGEEEKRRRKSTRNKIIKWIVSVAATFVLIVAALIWFGEIPVYSGNGLQLRSNGNGILHVDGVGKCRDTAIVIPSEYLGMPVTRIGNSAFEDCSSLTSVTIGNGVTSIGYEAFQYCSSLTSIVIPDGVTSIGDDAFYGCSSLTSIVIPDSVTSIGDSAFYNCRRLTSIQFGGTVAQWKAIYFGYWWDDDTGKYTVTCTDGTVAKNGTVTYN